MPREDKPLILRPVDDPVAAPEPVVRLANPETDQKPKPVRLTPPPRETTVSKRLTVPTRDEVDLRTHQPSIDALIESDETDPDHLENDWGDPAVERRPVPWGWFVLLGLAICGAILWSLSQVEEADSQAATIRTKTVITLVDDEREQQEATALIDRIESSLHAFYQADSPQALTALIRHPERVGPLVRDYYSKRPLPTGRLSGILSLQPLTLEKRGNFWVAVVEMSDQTRQNLILEISESGEPLFDWETLVCHQPVPWDQYATARPPGELYDFRVYVRPDNLHSHEFADASQWACFQLSARNSEETLFGYVPANSQRARTIQDLIRSNGGNPTSMILRLGIPEKGLRSHRGVLIEKLICPRWIFLDSPDSQP